MTAKVRVLPLWNLQPLPKGTVVISTVSRSSTWSKGLSPFLLGPCKLYGDHISENMENAWQYSKVYSQFLTFGGKDVDASYWKWAKAGWAKKSADRYPMGKGIKPEFSLWDGKHLTYVEARSKIYIPVYRYVVRRTDAYKQLVKIYNEVDDLVLLDFDAYDHASLGYTFDDVINDPNKKMGHAFVLAMMLDDNLQPKDK